jgi:hypothetical protein
MLTSDILAIKFDPQISRNRFGYCENKLYIIILQLIYKH